MPEIYSLHPIVFFAIICALIYWGVFETISPRNMATTDMQAKISLKEQLVIDYQEWQLQADIYFDEEDFIGAYGAASMAATKLKQLSELEP